MFNCDKFMQFQLRKLLEQNLFNLNEIIESALKEYKIHNFLYDSKIVVSSYCMEFFYLLIILYRFLKREDCF